MRTLEENIGRFDYYARSAKGEEDVQNPYPDGTAEAAEWHSGYQEAFYEQRRFYLAATPETIAQFLGINKP